MNDSDLQPRLADAARATREADALVILAGAGMGVDSGLPDFRGTEGFWRAYPPLARLGVRFEEMANPDSFARDPALAWGFYGHRLRLYRETTPHEGFAILLRWAAAKPAGYFVFTTNVDGQFQKASFDPDRVLEYHSSIHHLQCTRPCRGETWPADGVSVSVDEATMRAADPLPRCLSCGRLARPNILMFGDAAFVESRTAEQQSRYDAWVRGLAGRWVALVECGAGSAIPSVRDQSEWLAGRLGGTLIRINLREPQTPHGHVPLPMPALAALRAIDAMTRA